MLSHKNAAFLIICIFNWCHFVHATQQDPPLVVLRAFPPLFSAPKNGENAMGTVVIEVQIDWRGTVVAAKPISGHPALRQSAELAARRWLFSSTNEEAKLRNARLTFMFRFMEEGTSDDDLLPIFEPPFRIEVRRILPYIHTRSTR